MRRRWRLRRRRHAVKTTPRAPAARPAKPPRTSTRQYASLLLTPSAYSHRLKRKSFSPLPPPRNKSPQPAPFSPRQRHKPLYFWCCASRRTAPSPNQPAARVPDHVALPLPLRARISRDRMCAPSPPQKTLSPKQ